MLKKIFLFSLFFMFSVSIFSQELSFEQMKARFTDDNYKKKIAKEILNSLNKLNVNDQEKLDQIKSEIKSILFYSLEENRQKYLGEEQNKRNSKDYSDLAGLRDQELIKALYERVKGHRVLGYSAARKAMYSKIDRHNGVIEGVYTGRKFRGGGYNCEHTWPQSFFKKQEPMRSDIHHLFPALIKANSMRWHYLFGKVVKNVKWSEGGSKLGENERGEIVFEPRDEHKGNVARALFYFAVRYYNQSITNGDAHCGPEDNNIQNYCEKVLKEWNKLDPVDDAERARNDAIEKYQHNRNPFVDDPSLADRISNF